MDAALSLGGRGRGQTVLAALEAGDEVEVLGVHVQHHQPVTLGPEYDLLVAQPLAAEHLRKESLSHHTLSSVIIIAEAHLVHVGLGDGVLLHHGVTEHVPRGVLRGHPHVLEATVTTSLSVHDAVHKVAGYTVPGIIGIVGI